MFLICLKWCLQDLCQKSLLCIVIFKSRIRHISIYDKLYKRLVLKQNLMSGVGLVFPLLTFVYIFIWATNKHMIKKNRKNLRECLNTIYTGARRGEHKATIFLLGKILSFNIAES